MRIFKIKNNYLFNPVLLLFVISFNIVSLKIPKNDLIAYIDSNKNIHLTNEFMSGGEDFVPFVVGGIIFIPLFIELLISIILRKENIKIRLILMFFCIGLQSYLLYIWAENTSIFLNLLYGNIHIKIWIIIFIIFLIYFAFCSIWYFVKSLMSIRNVN